MSGSGARATAPRRAVRRHCRPQYPRPGWGSGDCPPCIRLLRRIHKTARALLHAHAAGATAYHCWIGRSEYSLQTVGNSLPVLSCFIPPHNHKISKPPPHFSCGTPEKRRFFPQEPAHAGNGNAVIIMAYKVQKKQQCRRETIFRASCGVIFHYSTQKRAWLLTSCFFCAGKGIHHKRTQ